EDSSEARALDARDGRTARSARREDPPARRGVQGEPRRGGGRCRGRAPRRLAAPARDAVGGAGVRLHHALPARGRGGGGADHSARLERDARFVLCEKSLTTGGAEALDVFRAAGAVSATVVEALMYRHHPAVQRVVQLVESGAAGAVDSVRAYFSLFDEEEPAGDDPLRDWRQQVARGGGVPYDLACYCVDAC